MNYKGEKGKLGPLTFNCRLVKIVLCGGKRDIPNSSRTYWSLTFGTRIKKFDSRLNPLLYLPT